MLYKKPRKNTLVELYGGIVSKLVKMIVNRTDIDIAELYQIAWLELYKSHKTYDGRNKFSTWCWTNIYWALNNHILVNKYGLGMSYYWYYCAENNGKINPPISTDDPLNNINLSDLPNNESNDNEINNRCITEFILALNRKYDKKTTNLIIDYYIKGLMPKQLQKKYGCYQKGLCKIKKELDVVFKDIKETIRSEYV